MLTRIYKNFNSGKLNFCSAGMSQEAFLPHINGVAARHFCKRKQQRSKMSGAANVLLSVDRVQKGKVTETDTSLLRGTCQHIVNISGRAHTRNLRMRSIPWWILILLNRQVNSKFYPHQPS